MHPRPDPQRDINLVRESLRRDHGIDDSHLTDAQIDAHVEAARERIGRLRQSRVVLAARTIALDEEPKP